MFYAWFFFVSMWVLVIIHFNDLIFVLLSVPFRLWVLLADQVFHALILFCFCVLRMWVLLADHLSFILKFVFCAIQNGSTFNWFLKFHILTCILILECECILFICILCSDICSDFPASQEVSDFRWLLVFYVLIWSVLQDVSAFRPSLLTSVMFDIFLTLCSQDVSVMWWLIFMIWCFCAL
jgi:hypothetical protein